jgi:segregation and condensation protein B
MNELVSKIESLLFVSNKPLSVKQLAKFSGGNEYDVTEALRQLKEQRNNSGIVLLEAPDGYQLATNSINTEEVKNFLNADLRESLTEATVEVLAIIAYRQPISKAEIESIRGVNSQYSLRALLMRGLIEKIPNPNDARGMLYQVTTEFLQHMGITSVNDLPNFNELVAKIKLPETAGLNSETTAQEAIAEIDAEQDADASTGQND